MTAANYLSPDRKDHVPQGVRGPPRSAPGAVPLPAVGIALRRAALAAAIIAAVTGTDACALQAGPAAPDDAAVEAATPQDLPAIGKWMIAGDGTVAHWLGEIFEGRRLREPINVILVDTGARDADHARARLVAAAAAAGYPVRFGHSTGYRALIGGRAYAQLPEGRDDAFSNRVFELSNNHGRLFGPHRMGEAFVSTGAFSREEVRLFRSPEHGYASFNRARDDFAHHLDRETGFKLSGFVALGNAIVGDPQVSTGDHDGLAVLLRAAP